VVIKINLQFFGGRGSKSGLSKKTSTDSKSDMKLEGLAKKYNLEMETYKKQMDEIASKSVPGNGMPQKYYDVQKKMNNSRKNYNEVKNEMAKRKKPDEKKQKTFVNSFGEATTREITSASYTRAQRRMEKDILRNMGY